MSITEAQGHLDINASLCLPAVDAFGDCDTTRKILGNFQQFLATVNGQFTSKGQLQQLSKMLQSESAAQQDVITAGLCLMVAVYGDSESDTL